MQQRLQQRFIVAGCEYKAIFAGYHHIGGGSGCGSNDRQTAGHGFNDDLCKTFEIAGEHKYVVLTQKCRPLRGRNGTCQLHLRRQRHRSRPLPITCQRKLRLRIMRQQPRPHPAQPGHSFASTYAAHENKAERACCRYRRLPFTVKKLQVGAVGVHHYFVRWHAVLQVSIAGKRGSYHNPICLLHFLLLQRQQCRRFAFAMRGPCRKLLTQLLVHRLFGQRVRNAGVEHKGLAGGMGPLLQQPAGGVEADDRAALLQQPLRQGPLKCVVAPKKIIGGKWPAAPGKQQAKLGLPAAVQPPIGQAGYQAALPAGGQPTLPLLPPGQAGSKAAEAMLLCQCLRQGMTVLRARMGKQCASAIGDFRYQI